MIFILGIATGILLSVCWSFYRFIMGARFVRRAGHQYVIDVLSTNEGIDYARKFLYVPKDQTRPFDMYNFAPNDKNKHFSFYEPLRYWYENC